MKFKGILGVWLVVGLLVSIAVVSSEPSSTSEGRMPGSAKDEDSNIEIYPEYGGEIEIKDIEENEMESEEFSISNVKGSDAPEEEPLKYEQIIKNYFEKLTDESDNINISTTSTISASTTTTSSTLTTTTTLCNGCVVENKCIPFSTRINNSYCDLDNTIKSQLDNGAECQNNYQCRSNFCTINVCRDIYQEIQENKNLLQKILDWLNNFLNALL